MSSSRGPRPDLVTCLHGLSLRVIFQNISSLVIVILLLLELEVKTQTLIMQLTQITGRLEKTIFENLFRIFPKNGSRLFLNDHRAQTSSKSSKDYVQLLQAAASSSLCCVVLIVDKIRPTLLISDSIRIRYSYVKKSLVIIRKRDVIPITLII